MWITVQLGTLNLLPDERAAPLGGECQLDQTLFSDNRWLIGCLEGQAFFNPPHHFQSSLDELTRRAICDFNRTDKLIETSSDPEGREQGCPLPFTLQTKH